MRQNIPEIAFKIIKFHFQHPYSRFYLSINRFLKKLDDSIIVFYHDIKSTLTKSILTNSTVIKNLSFYYRKNLLTDHFQSRLLDSKLRIL